MTDDERTTLVDIAVRDAAGTDTQLEYDWYLAAYQRGEITDDLVTYARTVYDWTGLPDSLRGRALDKLTYDALTYLVTTATAVGVA